MGHEADGNDDQGPNGCGEGPDSNRAEFIDEDSAGQGREEVADGKAGGDKPELSIGELQVALNRQDGIGEGDSIEIVDDRYIENERDNHWTAKTK